MSSRLYIYNLYSGGNFLSRLEYRVSISGGDASRLSVLVSFVDVSSSLSSVMHCWSSSGVVLSCASVLPKRAFLSCVIVGRLYSNPASNFCNCSQFWRLYKGRSKMSIKLHSLLKFVLTKCL